jgi:transketolase
MRTAFINALIELAQCDNRIMLLTGDLGYTVVEPFQQRFPDRFFNVGVAEQNMIGIATGLAKDGYIPFVYSIAPFVTLRPYESIRDGPVLHELPVRIVGVGDGFDYGPAGFTHHGLEDVGVMRLQPGMTVIVPVNAAQTRDALLRTWDLPGPVYYRIGKAPALPLPGQNIGFDMKNIDRIIAGCDLLLLAMGGIVSEAVKAADLLHEHALSAEVTAVACISPEPREGLIALLHGFPLVATMESHYVRGGLGSLVAEIIAEEGIDCRLVRFGVSGAVGGTTGSAEYLRSKYGLTGNAVANRLVIEAHRLPSVYHLHGKGT